MKGGLTGWNDDVPRRTQRRLSEGLKTFRSLGRERSSYWRGSSLTQMAVSKLFTCKIAVPIKGQGGVISIDAVSYEYPTAKDTSDANWLSSEF